MKRQRKKRAGLLKSEVVTMLHIVFYKMLQNREIVLSLIHSQFSQAGAELEFDPPNAFRVQLFVIDKRFEMR